MYQRNGPMGFFAVASFWFSSEGNPAFAWSMNYYLGAQFGVNKVLSPSSCGPGLIADFEEPNGSRTEEVRQRRWPPAHSHDRSFPEAGSR